MKTLKKYAKMIGLFLGVILLFSLLLALFNSFDLLYFKATNTIVLIGMILLLFIIGFEFGKRALKQGYLEGIKIGFCLIFLMIVTNLIFYQTGFSIERIIYYVVLILASTLGSMVGINKKH